MNFNDFPLFDENEEIPNGSFSFMGGIPLSQNQLTSILNNISKLNRNTNICTIFNGKFIIQLIDIIDMDDYSKILLECTLNPDYIGPENPISLYDAYNYLKNTHFLGFALSKVLQKDFWWDESVDLQIQVIDNNLNGYSKILILVDSHPCPKLILDVIDSDPHQVKSVGVINAIPTTPIFEKVQKNKIMHSPILSYDITLGFNKSSKINFENIDINNLYIEIIGKYIDDALDTFYPERKCMDQLSDMGLDEKLLRVTFEISYQPKLMNIIMICTPAMYISNHGEDVYKYHFVGNEMHLNSVSPINVKLPLSKMDNFCRFLDTISSSDCSQIITLYTTDKGNRSKMCELFNISKSADIIFTPHIAIAKSDRFNNDPSINGGRQRYFPNFKIEYSAHEAILDYWCPLNETVVSIDMEDTQKIKIIGFINFDTTKIYNKSFDDIYHQIHLELYHKFGITMEDYQLERFIVMYCYRTSNIVRVILTSNVDIYNKQNKVDTPRKKKLPWFGGK